MKKQIALAVAVLVVILAGFYILGSKKEEVANNSKPIKIGLILPLTGDLGFIGEAGKGGALLAIEKINNNASLKNKYELVIEDDSFDAKKTASAINKLLSIDKVNAVISVSSTGGNVVAPIAEKNEVPHIGLASDSNVAKGEYNFTHWTRPKEETTMLISELQKRSFKKVAVINVNQQGYKAINDDFKSKISGTDITIVADEVFNSGEKDFKTIISRTSKQNPDIYIIGAFSPEIEVLGKQLKEMGVKTPLTSVEAFGLASKPEIFEGNWFIDASVDTDNFKEEYKAKFNKEVGPSSANVYDAVNLMIMAIENSTNEGAPSGAQISKSLSETKGYSGALGILTISPEGEFISTPSVKIIKEGKAVIEK